jgi:hypothetical protein
VDRLDLTLAGRRPISPLLEAGPFLFCGLADSKNHSNE